MVDKPKKERKIVPKTIELEQKIKKQSKEIGKLTKDLEILTKGVANDIGALANQFEKIDALVDRHSGKLRGLEANMNRIGGTFGEVFKRLDALEPTPEEEPEEVEEEG